MRPLATRSLACVLMCLASTNSFVPRSARSCPPRCMVRPRAAESPDESSKLLKAAARLRAEIAEAEGKSIEQVEAEAAGEKARTKARADEMAAERAVQAARREADIKAIPRLVLSVPATLQAMTTQAARAVERAHADGKHTAPPLAPGEGYYNPPRNPTIGLAA